MKISELFDLRKKNLVWKSTVAAGKAARTELGTVGLSIGQQKSTGDTSRVLGNSNIREASIGSRVGYDNYNAWKADCPPKTDFKKPANQDIEIALASGKDFSGRAGQWDHAKNEGWIYEYYLKKSNLQTE